MQFSLGRTWMTGIGVAFLMLSGCNDNGSAQPLVPTQPNASRAGNSPGGTGPGVAPGGHEGRIMVSTGNDGIAASAFPLNRVLDLNLLVYWKGVAPGQMAQVTFYSPDGQRFRQVHAGPTQVVPAMPGGSGTRMLFPIGGTAITAHGLAGQWRVEATLDDGVSRVSDTFELDL